jgi:hypothetical protein
MLIAGDRNATPSRKKWSQAMEIWPVKILRNAGEVDAGKFPMQVLFFA